MYHVLIQKMFKRRCEASRIAEAFEIEEIRRIPVSFSLLVAAIYGTNNKLERTFPNEVDWKINC